MYLKSIRRRRNCYGLLLALGILSGVFLVGTGAVGAVLFWGLLIAILTVLLIRQWQLLQAAMLIWDNRILVVPVALLDHGSGRVQAVDETVLSTFGLLCADRIYAWGLGGLWGTRLKTLEIDPKKVRLGFGNKRNWTFVEFGHGIASKQGALDLAQKLWYETGVTATLPGWL